MFCSPSRAFLVKFNGLKMSTLEGLQDGKEQDNGRWIVSLLSTKSSYIELAALHI